MIESPHDVATLVSMTLTVPTIVFGIGVLILFWRDVLHSYYSPVCERHHWLIIGIFVGFLGGTLDNIYWAIPWSLDYMGQHEVAAVWHKSGAAPNIFSRQLCSILAAYCHIRSGEAVVVETDVLMPECYTGLLRRLINVSVASSIVFVLVLVTVKMN